MFVLVISIYTYSSCCGKSRILIFFPSLFMLFSLLVWNNCMCLAYKTSLFFLGNGFEQPAMLVTCRFISVVVIVILDLSI